MRSLLKIARATAEKKEEDSVSTSLEKSRMWKKTLLAGLIAFAGSAGLAHGQYGLGTPLPSESTRETGSFPIAPSGPSVESRTNSSPRVQRPIFGNLARAMLTPIRAAAGHLMPPQPLAEMTPTKDDIARMIASRSFSSAEITAAKIKLDEAQAKARHAAVRYLATVDCNYYPEAEAGLITALRADRNENVRHEAAVVLGTCRGTTKKIVEALSLTALGQETDGNPSENSERVRLAARNSLNRALANGLAMYPMEQPQMMPTMNWPDPYALQPENYYLPTAPRTAPTVSQQERDLAETVSVQAKSVAAPTLPRSLVEWIRNYLASREATRNATPARKAVDPRLRGLSPLGPETRLAIPSVHPNSTAFPYSLPYNDE